MNSQILVILGQLWNGLADSEYFLRQLHQTIHNKIAATHVATFINSQIIMSKPRGSEYNCCFPASLITCSIICEWFVNNLWIHRLFTDYSQIHRLFTDYSQIIHRLFTVYIFCEFQKKVWSRKKFSPRCVRTPERSGNGFGWAQCFSLDSFFHF